MDIREVVKEKYGQAALRVQSGGSSCCGASAALDGCCDPITSNLYDALQAGAVPELLEIITNLPPFFPVASRTMRWPPEPMV